MNEPLLEHYLKDLHSSGLSEETIRLSGCFSALVFPYFCNGGREKFVRVPGFISERQALNFTQRDEDSDNL